MKTRLFTILITSLLAVGCSNQNWTPEQLAKFLDNCENNGGIHVIKTYPGNKDIYSVFCVDGAMFKYLDTK